MARRCAGHDVSHRGVLRQTHATRGQRSEHAFWQACHGGQRRAAEYLLARGADLNWIPEYAEKTPLEIAAALDTGREALLSWLRAKAAASGARLDGS